MAFLYEKFYVKIEQIATRTLNKMGGIVKYFQIYDREFSINDI